MFPRISRVGEETWLVELEPRLDPALNERVLTIAERLQRLALDGIRDIVPACASLAVHTDPDRVDTARVAAVLEELLNHDSVSAVRHTTHDIPVCYAPEYGLDLDAVSRTSECAPDEVVARHAGVEYRVYMLGFLPGFPYLGLVDERIAVARHSTPRSSVPAGSVGIAGRQTGIYPINSPGGWQIIGRTPVRLFDPAGDAPPLLRPGDRVRFVPIDAAHFTRLAASSEALS
jgi:inhibitor of KinA